MWASMARGWESIGKGGSKSAMAQERIRRHVEQAAQAIYRRSIPDVVSMRRQKNPHVDSPNRGPAAKCSGSKR